MSDTQENKLPEFGPAFNVYFQEKLTELDTAKSANTLYHYTTSTGAVGILEKAALWLTDIQFLNDSQEYEYAKNKIKNWLGTKYPECIPEETVYTDSGFHIRFANKKNSAKNNIDIAKEIFVQLILDDFLESKKYIASFSNEPDDLSQWRGYCSNGGYSIGFNSNILQNLSDLALFPCVYDESFQDCIIEEFLNLLFIHLQEHDEKNRYFFLTNNGFPALIMLCSILKHPSFSSEKEWRLITKPRSMPNGKLCFRPSNSKIIPYYEYKFSHLGNLINSIYIGPMTHSEIGKSGIRQCAGQNSFVIPKDNFIISKTPFRNL